MINRGSEWRKWNFHVHTKGTNKNDLFVSPNMEVFFLTFFKKAYENKISAIGVTDYFSIEKYIEAVEYQKNIERKSDSKGQPLFDNDEINFIKNIFLFPNVELRMSPTTQKGKLINIHCLFNPDYISNIEHDFLSKIENDESKNMTRRGITSYGKLLKPDESNENLLYREGINNFVVSIDKLKNVFKSNKALRDNTIIVVSNLSSDGASGTQQHYELFENEPGSLDGVRRSIYHLSDALFSAREKDIKYFLAKKSEDKEGYNTEVYEKELSELIHNVGSLKPCIVGCDAHSETELFNKFTWVKADLNFEGLKQICFEPEQRVKIQDDKPEFKEDKLFVVAQT